MPKAVKTSKLKEPWNIDQLNEEARAQVIKWFPTGSRIVCDPPHTDTDEDIVVLVGEGIEFVRSAAKSFSRANRGSMADEDRFMSLRRGDVNLIVTDSEDFYNRFEIANMIAKRFNLHDKSQRVSLFNAHQGRDRTV